MRGPAKQHLSSQVDRLIDEGEEVLKTKFNRSGGKFRDMNDPYVDAQAFRKWEVSCLNLVRQIGPAAQVWIDAFGGSHHNRHVVVCWFSLIWNEA